MASIRIEQSGQSGAGATTSSAADRSREASGKRPRDVRLDFFRGLCLVIIFIAHIYANPWAAWIPARFGFSDATEIFVFCSGMASAIAFGGVYRNRGFLLGTARVMFRCWQVYWAHIGVFLITAAVMVVIDQLLGGSAYVAGLKMEALFDERAKRAVVGLLTLGYVPNFFDILPMYLVILLMLPLVMALRRLGLVYAAAFSVMVWIGANAGWLALPAEPWSTRPWFFNPFGWQLIFFTGFALMAGWLPAPPVDRRLIWLTAGFVALTVPLAWWPLMQSFTLLQDARAAIEPLADKTGLGILRYLHFLSLAYLSWVAVGENGRRLSGPLVEVLRRLGQQSLAIFMAGLVLSFIGGALLNVMGRTILTVPLVNLGGIALLIAVARTTAWFKSEPWQSPRGAAQSTTTAAGPATEPRASGISVPPASHAAE